MSTSTGSPPKGASKMQKLAIKTIVSLYRWTGGAIGERMGPGRVLLLTTTGRKSGQPHTVPVSGFEADETLFIVASNSGIPRPPAWYLNLIANPTVQIQRRRTVQSAIATTASPEQRAALWSRLVAMSPQYARYQQNNPREIPIIILTPKA